MFDSVEILTDLFPLSPSRALLGSRCFAFVCSDEKCCSAHTEKLEQSRLLVSYLTEAAIPPLTVIMQAASFFKVIPGDKRAGLRGEFLEDVRSYTGVFYRRENSDSCITKPPIDGLIPGILTQSYNHKSFSAPEYLLLSSSGPSFLWGSPGTSPTSSHHDLSPASHRIPLRVLAY